MSASSSSSSSSLTLTSTATLSDSSSTRMPLFGLGTWRSSTGEARAVVAQCLKHGYRHIDAAWIYGNQQEVGEGIADAIAASGGKLKREDIFITSKVWNHQQSPTQVEASCRETLKQLGIDSLDLLLLHWPTAWASSEKWPEEKVLDTSFTREQTWRAMEGLVEKKLVRTIGVSNFQIAEVEEVLKFAKIKPVVNQVELHPYFPQTQLREWAAKNGVHITSYSPLGNLGTVNEPGLTRAKELAAKFNVEAQDFTPLKDPVIIDIGQKKKKSPAQVIIRWHLQHGLTVIPKTVKEERLKENADVFDFELSPEEMQAIDRLSEDGGKRVRFVNPPFRGKDTVFSNDHQSR